MMRLSIKRKGTETEPRLHETCKSCEASAIPLRAYDDLLRAGHRTLA